MADVPFFKECEIKRVQLRCFRFGILMFQDEHAMTACLDVNHAMKRYAYHLATSARTVCFGEYKVELAILLKGGLSYRSYASVDIQSDSCYAKKLNVGFLPGVLLKGLSFKVDDDRC